MKRLLTKEEIKQLKEAEYHFNTVIDLQYKRATGSKLDNMVSDIWLSATGEKVSINCPKCLYNLYYNCGKLYRESKDELAKQQTNNKLEKNGRKNAKKHTDNDSITEEEK